MRTRQLRSTEQDLRRLFETDITLKHIATDLDCRNSDEPASDTRLYMESRSFDEIGVKIGGATAGYARAVDLKAGTLGDWMVGFTDETTLPASTPLSNAIHCILENRRMYVRDGSVVWGIATKADLDKLPVRLYLYGLITLIEMQMLRLVRSVPESDLRVCLKARRIDQAVDTHSKRTLRGTETDLAECLEFCDKYNVLLKQPWFLTGIAMSKTKALATLGRLQNMRDDLAHAEPIDLERPETKETVLAAPQLLVRLESIVPEAFGTC